MSKKIFFCPRDLIEVFKILKKQGIFEFEEMIPSFLLDFIYGQIWKILYKAKLLSKHANRLRPSLIDIEIACKLELKEVENKKRNMDALIFSGNIINTISLPEVSENNFFELPDKNIQLVEKNFFLKKIKNKM
ncbi:hypothetical protein CMESO_441 (nucleomorph) [Chroomonas mesostigmatica CCMP1168]|uniref:Uncharacterized protein n=1 Tax=Chroomonas mesostigmatica CCMP1168 TaxID=1195612 RepID=J7G8M9_9CRYP|nr:hypothetical protein CMESO_441 [Chroomonas mesostigmatica CCMP1168]|mmetsp:Transcript_47241/g.115035  ORF Transcript_47241/g.115035 Transcript_47241/m.115035 type:complete len:133 (-) Transcript_47241:223-621(-)